MILNHSASGPASASFEEKMLFMLLHQFLNSKQVREIRQKMNNAAIALC